MIEESKNGKNDQEMPKTDSPKMAKIEFSVPPALKEEADRIAEEEGWKPSELYRNFWVLGLKLWAIANRFSWKDLRE